MAAECRARRWRMCSAAFSLVSSTHSARISTNVENMPDLRYHVSCSRSAARFNPSTRSKRARQRMRPFFPSHTRWILRADEMRQSPTRIAWPQTRLCLHIRCNLLAALLKRSACSKDMSWRRYMRRFSSCFRRSPGGGGHVGCTGAASGLRGRPLASTEYKYGLIVRYLDIQSVLMARFRRASGVLSTGMPSSPGMKNSKSGITRALRLEGMRQGSRQRNHAGSPDGNDATLTESMSESDSISSASSSFARVSGSSSDSSKSTSSSLSWSSSTSRSSASAASFFMVSSFALSDTLTPLVVALALLSLPRVSF
jgi:hypothetical protein